MRHSVIINGKYVPTRCGKPLTGLARQIALQDKKPLECQGELEHAPDGSHGTCPVCEHVHRFDEKPRARRGRA